MALVKKVKLTIFESKHKPFVPKEGGEKIENWNVAGLNEKNEVIRFSSPDGRFDEHVCDVESYDPDQALDVELAVREWDGKKKYRALEA